MAAGRPDGSRRSRALLGVLSALLAAVGVVAMPMHSAATVPTFTGVSSRMQSSVVTSNTDAEHSAHPALHLVSAMAPWKALEPADQTFDWTRMNANVAAARAGGYRLILRIMAGRLSPDWLGTAGGRRIALLGTDPNATDYCDEVTTPLPWDPVLEQQYTELMREVGRWLDEPDGAGGRKGDHVYLIPVSMPSFIGSEMVIGYGTSSICPAGTDGAGQNLHDVNLARWNAVSTQTERRTKTEQAWYAAIDIHMRELPTENDSVIGYGHLFNDGQAAALRLASDQVARYPDRLWSVYTNLQPSVRGDGSFGPWAEWCPVCDGVIRRAIERGGVIGFQPAATIDTSAKFHAAIDDALATYPMAYLETGPEQIDRYEGYLLTDPASVQDRLADVVDNRITSTAVSCGPATVGVDTVCAATVSEFAGDPPGAPGGPVTWSVNVPGSFSPATCAPEGGSGIASCSVTFTPGRGSAGPASVTAGYAGDATHFASTASLGVTIGKRSTTTSISCGSVAMMAGQTTTCTASVTDADAGVAITPTGTVSWATNGNGTFSPTTCTLSGSPAACSVSFRPTSTGRHDLSASYGGGADHTGSTGFAAPIDVRADVPPTVTITSPTNGGTVAKGKTVVIAASASDDVGIVSVRFSVGTTVVCTDTTAPYTCSWAVPKKANAKYTISATATDTATNTATHTITVTAR